MVFRRIPKFADDYRRFPEKTEDVSNIYHTYLRVQSPESRVQSPVQSPVLVLDYAVKIVSELKRNHQSALGDSVCPFVTHES